MDQMLRVLKLKFDVQVHFDKHVTYYVPCSSFIRLFNIFLDVNGLIHAKSELFLLNVGGFVS